ncbi:hypothetical protein PIROE2DRAFT_15361, partial [Piromyces sp. E2]
MNYSQNKKNDEFYENKHTIDKDDEENRNKKIKLSKIISSDNINNNLKDNFIPINKSNISPYNSQSIDENNDLMLQFNSFFKVLDPIIPHYYNRLSDIIVISKELSKKLEFYKENHPEKAFLKIGKNNLLEKCPSLFIPYKERNFDNIYSLCKNGILNHQIKPMSLSSFLEIYKNYGPDIIRLPDELDIIKLCLKYASLQYLEYKIMFNNIYKLLPLYIRTKNLSEKEFNEVFSQRLSIGVLPLFQRNQVYNLIKRCYIDILECESDYIINEELKQNIMNISFEEKTEDKNIFKGNKAKTIIINNDKYINEENSHSKIKNNIIETNSINNDNLLDSYSIRKDNVIKNSNKYTNLLQNDLSNDIIISNSNQASLISINKLNILKKTNNNSYLSDTVKKLDKNLNKIKRGINQNQNEITDNNVNNSILNTLLEQTTDSHIQLRSSLLIKSSTQKLNNNSDKSISGFIDEKNDYMKNKENSDLSETHQIHQLNSNNEDNEIEQKKYSIPVSPVELVELKQISRKRINNYNNIDSKKKMKLDKTLKHFNKKICTGSDDEVFKSSKSENEGFKDIIKGKSKSSNIKNNKKEKNDENESNTALHECIITSNSEIEIEDNNNFKLNISNKDIKTNDNNDNNNSNSNSEIIIKKNHISNKNNNNDNKGKNIFENENDNDYQL